MAPEDHPSAPATANCVICSGEFIPLIRKICNGGGEIIATAGDFNVRRTGCAKYSPVGVCRSKSCRERFVKEEIQNGRKGYLYPYGSAEGHARELSERETDWLVKRDTTRTEQRGNPAAKFARNSSRVPGGEVKKYNVFDLKDLPAKVGGAGN